MCQAAARLLKAMQLLSKDFPEGPRSCVGTHLTLVLGLDECAKVGEGSSPHRTSEGQRPRPSGSPACSPSGLLVLPVPGGDLTTAVLSSPQDSTVLGTTASLPPSPWAPGLPAGPRTSSPALPRCHRGLVCAFAAFSGHSPPCCSLTHWMVRVGLEPGSPLNQGAALTAPFSVSSDVRRQSAYSLWKRTRRSRRRECAGACRRTLRSSSSWRLHPPTAR